jgi:hypothetical protein
MNPRTPAQIAATSAVTSVLLGLVARQYEDPIAMLNHVLANMEVGMTGNANQTLSGRETEAVRAAVRDIFATAITCVKAAAQWDGASAGGSA